MIIDGLQIEGIWFDLDNTLIDRDAAMLSYLKTHWSTTPEMLKRWIQLDDRGYAARPIVCGAIAKVHETTRDAVWTHMRAHLGNHVPTNMRLIDALSRLSRHVSIGLISNGSGSNQRLKLRTAGLTNLFEPERIIISGEVEVAKPEADIFKHAQRHMRCAPHHMLMVGDNAVHDCQGAHEMGMKTMWLSAGRLFPKTLDSPTWSLENMEILTDWIIERISNMEPE